MYEGCIPLNLLPIGDMGRVRDLTIGGRIRRRMLDLGLIKGTEVQAVTKSPSGDPVAYFFRGVVIALRSEEASAVIVEKLK
ncbi:MAG: ferrous iron transport protein A [Clostridiales bacterium]|nr:ferrous iron transport protein A [Clostridiales bacterium]